MCGHWTSEDWTVSVSRHALVGMSSCHEVAQTHYINYVKTSSVPFGVSQTLSVNY
jgi:hypothetical protein